MKGMKESTRYRLLVWGGFVIVALLIFIYIYSGSMLDYSGDSVDIWQTITSIGTGEVYGSYVLYKGFNAIYPYYWLYKLAVLTGAEQEIFIKMFYAMAFSYVTVFGFPVLFEMVTGKKVFWWKRILFSIICFYFWLPSGALTEMMVDLPCMMYFLMMLNCIYRIKGEQKKRKELYFLYTIAGFFSGLCLTASGQYSLPTYILITFVIVGFIRNRNTTNLNVINVMFFLIPACLVKIYNYIFLNTFVESLKQKGAWIPNNRTWLTIGFPRFSNVLCTDYRFYTNRIYDLFLKYYNIDEISMTSGSVSMEPLEYILFVLHHIPSFTVAYFNSFFTILSPVGPELNIIKGSIFYSFVFLFILFIMKMFNEKREVFVSYIEIITVFIAAVIPLMVMNIEQRCCMQIQGLILSTALFGINYSMKIKGNYKGRMCKLICVGITFIMLCLIHLATLYDVNYFTR